MHGSPTTLSVEEVKYTFFRICVHCSALSVFPLRKAGCVCRSSGLCTLSASRFPDILESALAVRPRISYIDRLFITGTVNPESNVVYTTTISQKSQQIAAKIGKRWVTAKNSSPMSKAVSLSDVLAYCCSQISEWKQNQILHFLVYFSVSFTFLCTPKWKEICTSLKKPKLWMQKLKVNVSFQNISLFISWRYSSRGS